MEVSALYNRDGELTGKTINRGEPIGEDNYVAASVVVVRWQGFYLITKRHPNKSSGGMWEFPGGGLNQWETPIQAAKRELEEETGICANLEELKEIGTVCDELMHLFLHVFLLDKEVLMNQLKLQQEETVQALKVNRQELELLYDKLTKADQLIFNELGEKF